MQYAWMLCFVMGGREEVGGFQDSLKLQYFSRMQIKEGREVV